MNLPFEIAWRYLKRPADKLVSAVGAVSVFGLVIGVMALVISMALMTGYRRDLQEKLLAGNAEIFVYSIGGAIGDLDRTVAAVGAIPGVREASPVLFQQALVSSELQSTGEQVMLKGIEPKRVRTSQMIAKIVGPSTFRSTEGTPGVAVGQYLARKLRVKAGSTLLITVPSENSGSFLPRTGSFVITNVFNTGFYDFDARWVFLDLDEARDLLNQPAGANLIEVKLQSGADLDDVMGRVEKSTARRYAVSDWRDMNRQLFSMLKIQQLVLFIVIGLIVFVSTFNVVSTLVMTVHEKRREIGILTSMGGQRRFIGSIFVWYGTLVGLVGTAAGLLLGFVVCWVITKFKLISFGPEIAQVYFVSSIPFVTRWQDLLTIAAFASTVSFLATIPPSLRAAKLNPIDALRHE